MAVLSGGGGCSLVGVWSYGASAKIIYNHSHSFLREGHVVALKGVSRSQDMRILVSHLSLLGLIAHHIYPVLRGCEGHHRSGLPSLLPSLYIGLL